jgi:FMN reductase
MAEDRGARTIAFDGAQLADLPIFSAHDVPSSDIADALVDAVRQADAVVIATPGYHGSMSGLVKNAIDHLELLREDVRPYLDGRAVGVIVSAAGWQACGTTLVSVRSTVHALRGWPTPFGVTVNSAEQQADDPRVTGALEILAGQLIDFTSWQAAARASAR